MNGSSSNCLVTLKIQATSTSVFRKYLNVDIWEIDCILYFKQHPLSLEEEEEETDMEFGMGDIGGSNTVRQRVQSSTENMATAIEKYDSDENPIQAYVKAAFAPSSDYQEFGAIHIRPGICLVFGPLVTFY